jgi:hypothetical protein
VGTRNFKRNRENNDQTRIFRKRIESLERENKRLRKIIDRMDLGPETLDESEEIPKNENVENTVHCPKCKCPAKLWTLPLRSGEKRYTVCDRCGTIPYSER